MHLSGSKQNFFFNSNLILLYTKSIICSNEWMNERMESKQAQAQATKISLEIVHFFSFDVYIYIFFRSIDSSTDATFPNDVVRIDFKFSNPYFSR